MLNAGRKSGSFVLLRKSFGGRSWLAAKIVGYKPILWLISPLQFLLRAKNRIGYPLVPATYRLVARSRFELHLPNCDITGHLPYSGRCPFLFYKLVCACHPERPGIWTANQRAAPPVRVAGRDPKELAGARRFWSMILVSLRICAGGEGKGMCKGNMNTIERINNRMNYAFALAGMEWTKGANNVSRPDLIQSGRCIREHRLGTKLWLLVFGLGFCYLGEL